MENSARTLLRALDCTLELAFQKGLGSQGLTADFPDGDPSDPELLAIRERLARFVAMLNESQRFAVQLAAGDLDAGAARDNLFTMPLKALQANLRHLTWQAGRVAAGDLAQQVYFLGDFSAAFNQMIQALRDKQTLEKRLQTITEVLGEGVYLVDTEGRLEFMNPEAERLLGYRFEDLAGQPIHRVIYGQYASGVRFDPDTSPLVSALKSAQEFRDEDAVFVCKSGFLLPVALVCRPILEADSHTGAVVAFHDISAQKKHRQSLEAVNRILEKQAITDPLTGILNRLKLAQILDSELKRAQRYATPLAVVLFDIDHFKAVNDTFGHLAGDEVLKDVARVVAKDLRDSDTFARWGGEEFMVVLPDTTLEHARACAEKLRQTLAAHSFPHAKTVTASFGVAAMHPQDSRETLTNRADQALYGAKQNGRNRVECER